MPQIVVLPNPMKCPDGAVIEARSGQQLCQQLLDNDVDIDHACQQSCACTTCHVVLVEGAETVRPAGDLETSITKGVFGFGPNSRLSCQVMVGQGDLVVEIP
ncbi:MAG: ISC system 2Fe-2S type ferredoxin [Candidatus Pelagadaptatus aseana]|uniref:2Fe-2S iron-sulfur cluster-binding protein n=1 Tax=Candidatus Pelagadaptatus aseana TaxID=3120508 RepID=UPI0039B3304D